MLVSLCLISLQIGAQTIDTSSKVDTLSFAERFSVRTNTVDWLLLLPNFSVEYDLGKYNWNRYSVGVGVRYNWQTKHSFTPAQVYNICEVRGEFRQYWRTRKIVKVEGKDRASAVTSVMPAKNFLQRLFSTNRYEVKHPNTTYYRGLFVSYSKYSMLLSSTGRQGTGLTAGVLYGVLKPLYQFKNGNSLDIEFGISAGLCFTKYDKYRHDRESDCYPVMERKGWHIEPYPVLSETRIAFVYRFGSYPLTKKYRWRYDVDEEYKQMVDESNYRKSQKLKERLGMDDLRALFEKMRDQYMPDALKEARKASASQQEKAKMQESKKKQAIKEKAREDKKTVEKSANKETNKELLSKEENQEQPDKEASKQDADDSHVPNESGKEDSHE